MISFLLISRCN